jgi:hypothetical protein
MSDDLQLSIHFLECILQNGENCTAQGLSELFEIKNGNKKIILKHLKAITNIMSRAINELEGDE